MNLNDVYFSARIVFSVSKTPMHNYVGRVQTTDTVATKTLTTVQTENSTLLSYVVTSRVTLFASRSDVLSVATKRLSPHY